MAKASLTEITRTITERTVRLTLTEEEAQFLIDLTALIGGSPTRSRRRHNDSIRDALRDAGLDRTLFADDLRGGITALDAKGNNYG